MTEITPATNLLNRVLKEIKKKARAELAIIIACVATLIALFSWNDAKDARHISEAKLEAQAEKHANEIEELTDDVETMRFQISLLHADLKSRGFEIPDE